MIRTFVVKENMTLQSLGSALLDARFGGAQAEVALNDLKRFNAHLDLARLTPGTIVLVPDSPSFKVSATGSTPITPFEDFRKQAASALDAANAIAKSGFAARAAARGDVSTFLKSAAFKRLAAGDEILGKQVDEANGLIAADEEQDKKALENLDATSRSALDAIGELSKIVG